MTEWKQRKFKIKNYMRDNFPLFITHWKQLDQARHSHDFTEIVFIEKGKGEHITKNSHSQISTGDVLVAPLGTFHGYRNTEKLRLLNVIFEISLLKLLGGDIDSLPGFQRLFGEASAEAGEVSGLFPDEISHIAGIINKMRMELADRRPGYKTECVSLLLSLAVLLSRKSCNEHKQSRTPAAGQLDKVLDYMEMHCRRKIDMEHLAKLSSCSLRNFERIFRKTIGCTPASYIIDIKLRQVKNLLRSTSLSISEIAAETGFGTGAYLARQFKKNLSMTAKNYRTFSARSIN